jgi:O-antigen/teichoic acid export membrane protein
LVAAARTLTALVTIGIPIVMVRVLPQSTFGHYKQLFLVAGTALPLLSLGLPGSLYYFVPRQSRDSQRLHVQTALMLSLMGALGGGIILLLRGPLSEFFDAPIQQYLVWIALYTALSVPASLLEISPMVDRRARLAALFLSGFDLLRGVVLILVALLTRNLTAILVAVCTVMTLQVGVVTAYLLWRGDGQAWKPSSSHLRNQLAYALPFTGAALIGLAQMKLHAYYVAGRFSSAQFAIYAVATLSIPLIDQFSRTIGEVVIIENAKHYAAKDFPEMRRVWHRATHVLSLVLLPLFMILELFAYDIITLLFGESYRAAAPIFRVYLLLLPLSIFLGSQMLRATGDLKVMIRADAMSLAVTVVVLVLLAPALGPIGAVLSLVLGRATFMAMASRRTGRRLQVGIRGFLPWGSIAAMLAVSAIVTVLASLTTQPLGLPTALRIVVGGGFAMVLYAALVWWLGLVPEPEKELVRRQSAMVKGSIKAAVGRRGR